jgi:hypothetical protein
MSRNAFVVAGGQSFLARLNPSETFRKPRCDFGGVYRDGHFWKGWEERKYGFKTSD